MRKVLGLLLAILVLQSACGKNASHKSSETKPEPAVSTEPAQTDREKLESEVREGSSLNDPGGAKDLRDASAEQMKEQQEQVQEVDNQ